MFFAFGVSLKSELKVFGRGCGGEPFYRKVSTAILLKSVLKVFGRGRGGEPFYRKVSTAILLKSELKVFGRGTGKNISTERFPPQLF
ncbi:MAG: hypothetical protein J6A41_08130 [Ruminiclostridium sp.]|nr:hypothetical protein [Ruminiclostridium sp.]